MGAPSNLDFDFGFVLDDLKMSTDLVNDSTIDADGVVMLRSPRSPTYTGEHWALSGSVSPFDPDRFFQFPLSPPSHVSPASLSPPSIAPPPPPPSGAPLPWIWTCHLCRSRYPLGATRRCLIDGHFYCSGENANGNNSVRAGGGARRRKRREQTCSSQFDYAGWQEWTWWRRTTMQMADNIGRRNGSRTRAVGCNLCEYPSQCHYERLNRVSEVVVAVTRTADLDRANRTKMEKGSDRKTAAVKAKRRSTTGGDESSGVKSSKTCDQSSLEGDVEMST